MLWSETQQSYPYKKYYSVIRNIWAVILFFLFAIFGHTLEIYFSSAASLKHTSAQHVKRHGTSVLVNWHTFDSAWAWSNELHFSSKWRIFYYSSSGLCNSSEFADDTWLRGFVSMGCEEYMEPSIYRYIKYISRYISRNIAQNMEKCVVIHFGAQSRKPVVLKD